VVNAPSVFEILVPLIDNVVRHYVQSVEVHVQHVKDIPQRLSMEVEHSGDAFTTDANIIYKNFELLLIFDDFRKDFFEPPRLDFVVEVIQVVREYRRLYAGITLLNL